MEPYIFHPEHILSTRAVPLPQIVRLDDFRFCNHDQYGDDRAYRDSSNAADKQCSFLERFLINRQTHMMFRASEFLLK